MNSLHKIDKNTIIQIEKENYYYLNIFFQNYLNINNLQQQKYQKLYNTLVIDSIYQFYIIFNLIENDIKNINFKEKQFKQYLKFSGYRNRFWISWNYNFYPI
jgi:hypothetical protein